MHQRHTRDQTLDQARRLHACKPRPAEIDFEEELLLAQLDQPVHDGAAVVQRAELGVVVVEAEPEPGVTNRLG